MARRVSIGYQEFEDIIINDLFYVDKTQIYKSVVGEKKSCYF